MTRQQVTCHTDFGLKITKEECQRGVDTLGSMYAIKAEYKYSHGWLREKTNMHIKNPSCSVPSPRDYTGLI